MNTDFAYDKKDYYSILDYLKTQAALYSNNIWTDFSDADIGTVLLKLIAMVADTNNYQVEKTVSELYLDTVIERVNAIALCKLIGYEPRHYQSAHTSLVLSASTMPNNTELARFTKFTNSAKTAIFYNLKSSVFSGGYCNTEVYEGNLVSLTRQYSDITDTGKLNLTDYNIGTNTVIVEQGGIQFTKVDNALFGDSDACFSIHLNSDNQVYIQFPPYWENFIVQSTLSIYYLTSLGEEGKIGANILDGAIVINNIRVSIVQSEASIGGYNPETVEEIQKSAPLYATTMNTLVTLGDIDGLAEEQEGIADVVALDYNYPETGLIQPTAGSVNDAYKVNIYILPETTNSIYSSSVWTSSTSSLYRLMPLSGLSLNLTFPVDYYSYVFSQVSAGNIGTSIKMINMFDYTENGSLVLEWANLNTADSTTYCRVKLINEDTSTTTTLYEYTGDGGTVVNLSTVNIGNLRGFITALDATDTVFFSYIVANTSHYVNTYTEAVQGLKTYIDSHKLASIETDYYNVNYITPNISLVIYMDTTDLRASGVSLSVKEFLETLYKRGSQRIGQSLYSSHISAAILKEYSYIDYVNIVSMTGEASGRISAGDFDYIEVLADNISIEVSNYTG